MRYYRILLLGVFVGMLTLSGISVVRGEDITSKLWKVTYYCSCQRCCGKWSDGHFASGRKVYNGGVAVNWLKFNTKVKIDGKVYTVEDRGAVRYFGTKEKPILAVDVWLPSHQEALNRGVEYKEVEVLK